MDFSNSRPRSYQDCQSSRKTVTVNPPSQIQSARRFNFLSQFHQSRTSILFCVVAFVFGSVQVGMTDEPAEQQGRQLTLEETATTLAILAEQIRANYEAIETWKGKYSFAHTTRFDGAIPNAPDKSLGSNDASKGFMATIQGTAEFSVDIRGNQLHVLCLPKSQADAEKADEVPPDSKTLSASAANAQGIAKKYRSGDVHWILTSEHWLDFDLGGTRGQFREFPTLECLPRAGGRVVYRRTTEEFKRTAHSIDVRNFYNYGKAPFWQICQMYADTLRGQKGEEAQRVAEKYVTMSERQVAGNSQFVLTVKYPSKDGSAEADDQLAQSVAVFDSSAGFNGVSRV